MANGLIRTGQSRCALVIGAEVLTQYVDYTDRSTCVIFGDGAGAAILGPVEGEHLGFQDIQFESEQFNRAFRVKCHDPKFATDVIDDRMMQWLLSTQEHWAFEASGPYLMCYAKRLKPLQLTPLLGGLKSFRGHIPRVAWALYGTGQAPEPPAASQGLGFVP